MIDEATSILQSKKNKVQDPEEAFGMTIGATILVIIFWDFFLSPQVKRIGIKTKIKIEIKVLKNKRTTKHCGNKCMEYGIINYEGNNKKFLPDQKEMTIQLK